MAMGRSVDADTSEASSMGLPKKEKGREPERIAADCRWYRHQLTLRRDRPLLGTTHHAGEVTAAAHHHGGVHRSGRNVAAARAGHNPPAPEATCPDGSPTSRS